MVKPEGLKMTYVSPDDMMSASARAVSWFVPPVEIHVDGKIITGIEGRRKSVT